MFYFLILLGLILILFGIIIKKIQMRIQYEQPDELDDDSVSVELMDRLEQLEQMIFESFLNEEEKKAAELIKKTSTECKPMPDSIRTIVEYERRGFSVQEIVNITKMNKGEVLLLKNLSKHYLK